MSPSPADLSVNAYGASVILKYLQALRVEIPGVRAGKDIEAVHRMRVASRRLRAAFSNFDCVLPPRRGPIWQKQIRKVTQALSVARDCDVQLVVLHEFLNKTAEASEKPGIRRLILRLQQQRSHYQQNVLASLAQFEQSEVIEQMQSRLTPIADRKPIYSYPTLGLTRLGFEKISKRLAEFLQFDEYVYLPEEKAKLHAMRIAAKKVRYTMEGFAAIYPNELKSHLAVIRTVQELLGEIHDCDVWLIFLPAFISEETELMRFYIGHTGPLKRLTTGLNGFQANRQETRDSTYSQFSEQWEEWRATWSNLGETIRAMLPVEPAPIEEEIPETSNNLLTFE